MGNVDVDKWITHLAERKDDIALKISGLQAEQKNIEAFINILRPTGDEHAKPANGIHGGVGTMPVGSRWPTAESGIHPNACAGVAAVAEAKSMRSPSFTSIRG